MNVFANPQAELGLLASALEYPEVAHQAMALGIRADDFSEERSRVLWRLISKLGESGQPTTFEAMLTEVQKGSDADRLTAVLEDLTNPLYVPRKDVSWHVQELKDKSRRRQLVAACERAMHAAEDASESTGDCVSYLCDSLLRLEAESSLRDAVHVKDFMPQTLRDLEQRAKCDGLIGLPTGITELDEATTGIRQGELWVAGGLQGRGKTALAIQIALENAVADNPVAFFSLEMSRDELGERFLANESRVSASRIRNPRFIKPEQWGALTNCVSRMEDWPLYVDDSPTLNIQALTARAKLYVRRFGCRLVILDYIRLVQAPGDQLRERVANVADHLRQLAKSERIAVLALSQLARPKDQDINARPNMLSLKESGDVESAAHVVLLIYAPIQNDAPTGQDEILIAKNRHGAMGTIEVTFDKERLKFLPRSNRE